MNRCAVCYRMSDVYEQAQRAFAMMDGHILSMKCNMNVPYALTIAPVIKLPSHIPQNEECNDNNNHANSKHEKYYSAKQALTFPTSDT